MTDLESIQRLRQAPRDTTVVIEGNAALADALSRDGYHVLYVGPSATEVWTDMVTGPVEHVWNGQMLADNWSALSCRSSSAVCIGTKPLGRLVEHMTTRAQVNGNTSRYRSRGWCENLLANFHMLLHPTFGAFTGALDGVPAFIIGAGASLDQDYKLATKLYDKGIVIGLNASARIANRRNDQDGFGIALTIEGNDVRHKLGQLDERTVRAFSLFADPLVMEHGDGPAMPLFTGELAMVPEWLTGYQRLACSGLSGTAAVSLAERLGCNPIVLVGHEFHLTDGGRIYPECLGLGETRAHLRDGETGKIWTFEYNDELRAQKRQNPLNEEDLAVERVNAKGETVWSTRAFAAAASWFETASEKATAQLIQASHGGAVLRGWHSVTLDEVVRGLPNRPYQLAPNDNGLSPGVLLAWLEGQMRATTEAIEAGKRLHAEPSRERIEELRRALLRAPLAEPWCHATVKEVAEARRESAPSDNHYRERLAALEHASGVGWAIATDGPKLVEALVMAASRIRAEGGSELQDCRMPPGAADDLLRCALRSMRPYENMSRGRKLASWLRA